MGALGLILSLPKPEKTQFSVKIFSFWQKIGKKEKISGNILKNLQEDFEGEKGENRKISREFVSKKFSAQVLVIRLCFQNICNPEFFLEKQKNFLYGQRTEKFSDRFDRCRDPSRGLYWTQCSDTGHLVA